MAAEAYGRQGPDLMEVHVCVRVCMCVVRELGSQAFRPEVGGVGEALRRGEEATPLGSLEQ